MSRADQTNVPAVAAKTTPGPVAARRSPPRAGPAKLPTLSVVLDATLAAVSSLGLRASDGSRARHGERAGGVRGQHHALAPVAVAENGGEGSGHGRRDEANRADDADRGGAPR